MIAAILAIIIGAQINNHGLLVVLAIYSAKKIIGI
jgi:hypothetical protein